MRARPRVLASIALLLLAGSPLACGASGSSEPSGVLPNLDTGNGSDGSSDETTITLDSGGGGDTTVVEEDTRPSDDAAPPPEAGDGGVIPGCGLDSDGDGIIDSIEGRGAVGGDVDTDKDGTPDWQDLDSDGDGITDIVEWPTAGCAMPLDELNDADGDGIPNFQDTDSDNNGLLDKDELCPPATVLTKLGFPPCIPGKPYDFDSDGVPDYLDFDNDHDSSKTDKTLGLADKTELSDASGAYVGLVDTDGDDIPDLYDRDSDNDFILDLDDGVADPDGDGKPAFRDTDSDGDTVPDSCEARGIVSPGPADYSKPVLDSDGDGTFDFLDKDSDGDLLGDGAEDKDGNCVVGAAETDRLKADTDGDGVGDLVEVTLLGAPAAKDPTATPAKAGKFYFLEPYSSDGSSKPTPTSSPLALNTALNKGDVGFVVDTTFSMDGAINNLKSTISGTVIPNLAARIPDLGVGVMGHDDIPTSNAYGDWSPPYGSCQAISSTSGPLPPDEIFYVPTNGVIRDVSIGGVVQSARVSEAQTAVNGLRRANGVDLPESQVPAMIRAIRGDAFSWGSTFYCGGRSYAADTGDGVTSFGALRFRKSALPILVSVSDAVFHNGKKVGTTTIHDPYSGMTMPNSDTLVAAINAVNARFIGVATADAATADTDAAIRVASSARSAYGDMAYITDNTKSNVPPSAFPGGTCQTGIGGATVAADGPGGTCRLIFSVRKNGSGLGTSIVDGVLALLNGIRFDVHVQAIPAAGPVDSVNAFVDKIEPSPSGGTDPVTGALCVTFPSTSLADRYRTPKAAAGAGDIAETITQIAPGPKYCFNVVPKPNTTVTPTTAPQLFTATLRVRAENGTTTLTLGTDREVLFIVPPVLN